MVERKQVSEAQRRRTLINRKSRQLEESKDFAFLWRGTGKGEKGNEFGLSCPNPKHDVETVVCKTCDSQLCPSCAIKFDEQDKIICHLCDFRMATLGQEPELLRGESEVMSFEPFLDKRETLAQHISQPESEDSLGQSNRSMGQSYRTYASCRDEEDVTEQEFFAIDEAAEFKEEEE